MDCHGISKLAAFALVNNSLEGGSSKVRKNLFHEKHMSVSLPFLHQDQLTAVPSRSVLNETTTISILAVTPDHSISLAILVPPDDSQTRNLSFASDGMIFLD